MAPPTGGFFENEGATINRLNDRLLVGAATTNDGVWPNVAHDWLTAFQLSIGDSGTINTSQAAILTQALSTSLMTGLAVGARSASFNSAPSDGLAIAAFAINDAPTFASDVWAFYGEAHRVTPAAGAAIAMELDVRSTVSSVFNTPYKQNPGGTMALQLASGAGVAAAGQFNNTAAIQIEWNAVPFNAGIIFGEGAIADPGNGVLPAIMLAQGQALQWFNGVAEGTPTSMILGNVTTAANATGIKFDDTGFNVVNVQDGASVFQVPPHPGAVNRVEVNGGGPGVSPQVSAVGADTTVNLTLSPQGPLGVLNFRGPVAGAAGAIATYLSVQINGVAYKLACYAP